MKFTLAGSAGRTPLKRNLWLIACLLVFTLVWVSTFAGTSDLNNWLLENVLVFVFLPLLAAGYRRYQFSDLSYLLIFVYLCMHVYGSQYTYADNPFGYWLQEQTGSSRNHYDRIVHFSFGFLLAYPLRELFLVWFRYPAMAAWILPVEITLSVSGFYELIEWGVADVFFPAQGVSYLGTQGDVWDAQKDIFLAFSGALLSTSIVSALKRVWKLY